MKQSKIGQRKTTQREAISAVIRQAEGPLTVEEISARASTLVASLGLATVYRTVKLLLESNELSIVSLPHSHARYEASDLAHHHHFRCRKCDLGFDLPGCILPIPDGTSLPGGYKVEAHEVTLVGTCPECNGEYGAQVHVRTLRRRGPCAASCTSRGPGGSWARSYRRMLLALHAGHD